jgi:hypothetical protein
MSRQRSLLIRVKPVSQIQASVRFLLQIWASLRIIARNAN